MRLALPAFLLLAVPGAAVAATLDPLAALLAVAPRYERVAAPAAAVAGMRIERDAVTGELRAPEPEAVALETTELDHSDAGLVIEYLPDGSMRVNLEDRFQEVFMVTRGADGRLHPACVDGLKRAQQRIAAPALPATVWEDR